MSQSFAALRRANPRADAGFQESVEAAAAAVRARIASAAPARRHRVRPSVVAAALAVAALAGVSVAVGLLTGGPAVENAAAAMREAARASAASAEQSGAAAVQITHDGELWAARTLRWHGRDLAVSEDAPRGRRPGSHLLVVGDTMYGIDEHDGGWVVLGAPESIDPGSGTTPAEYLAAVREDVGGVTLRRITGAMTALTTRRLDDGSTVYSGRVRADQVARETGLKGGQPIRVLPFGYVAHGEAANPASLLDSAVTVGVDGIVRKIAVTWTAWEYTVAYSGLGNTPALRAPAGARPLRARLHAAK